MPKQRENFGDSLVTRMNAKRTQHLVVDGSNIATEGRTTPSLAQLDEAVLAVAKEGFDPITVIVDATFPRRIDAGEVDEFEARTLAGAIVTPPAGVVGRGDAFILQVAAQVDAVVLSNDSFQEFHGEHEWLLNEDNRLLGGKPVPNVGWVFAWRGVVRGPKSRQSIKEAKQAAKRDKPEPAQTSKQRAKKKTDGRNKKSDDKKSSRKALEKSAKKSSSKNSARKNAEASSKKKTTKDSDYLNDVNEFMSFVTKYSIGDTIEGQVERYSSHGCYLRVATAQCYLPIKAMGSPPPNKARDVVSRGDLVRAKVESLDAERRGINVSLVSVTPQADRSDQNRISNTPRRSENTMATPKKAAKKRTTKKAAPKKAAVKKTPAKKAAPKKAVKKAVKKAAPKKAAVKRTTKKAAPKKAAKKVVKKAAPKKAAPKKTAAKRTTKKAAPKKAAVKKAAPKKAAVKKTTARKAAPKKAVKKAVKKAAPKKAAAKTKK